MDAIFPFNSVVLFDPKKHPKSQFLVIFEIWETNFFVILGYCLCQKKMFLDKQQPPKTYQKLFFIFTDQILVEKMKFFDPV